MNWVELEKIEGKVQKGLQYLQFEHFEVELYKKSPDGSVKLSMRSIDHAPKCFLSKLEIKHVRYTSPRERLVYKRINPPIYERLFSGRVVRRESPNISPPGLQSAKKTPVER